MKRTNLVLNEKTLRMATRLMGAKTYSEAVNKALEEAIRLIQIRGLFDLAGSNAWQGNLEIMREDAPAKNKKRKTA